MIPKYPKYTALWMSANGEEKRVQLNRDALASADLRFRVADYGVLENKARTERIRLRYIKISDSDGLVVQTIPVPTHWNEFLAKLV